eukprot:gene2769-2810_t
MGLLLNNVAMTFGGAGNAMQDITGCIGRVGYMLQKDLLLPWRTVLDNVILGMEIRGLPVADCRARALPYLKRYGLGEVGIPRPRDRSVVTSPDFIALKTRCLDLLHVPLEAEAPKAA